MASIGLPVIGWLVSPIINKVMDHGILHLKERRELERGVPKEIDRLSKVLPQIRGLLEDAEETQSKNSSVLSWLGELKEVLYDAEDLLDLYEVDLALKNDREEEQSSIAMGWKAKVRDRFLTCLSTCQESSTNLSVAKQIKSIRERLDDISKRGHELGLREMATSTSAQGNTTRVWQSRETTSFLADDSTMLGRADEKRAIVNMLLDDSKKLSVLPIIGMGGLGKTTLARLLFNDKKVEAFFKSKVWLCIGMSQELDLKRLMIQIINSVCGPQKRSENYDYFTLDSLQRTIVEEIKDKQPFLLVLDDAWDTKVYNWGRLLEPLKATGLTCKVVVTTRDRKVADAIRSDRLEPVVITFLKEIDMWNIFRRHAFGSETVDVDPELESIGKQIIQKLKGLPLAAEIIGGLLHGNIDATCWMRILKSKIFEIKEEENYMLSILMLSYDSLSTVLKQCFLYFSLFPKDHMFVLKKTTPYYSLKGADVTFVSQILHIWMSQRLIKMKNGIAWQDIGSEIIAQLSDMSLLQRTEFLHKASFTIHDLVHDLVEKISKEEFLRGSDVTEHNLSKKLRHISFFEKGTDNNEVESEILWDLRRCTTLRTFLFYKFYTKVDNYTSLLDGCFNSLIYLRALSLHNKYMTSLPDSIGNLKLLRYLDLILPRMEKLPDSVSSLHNLQVMVLVGCDSLSTLDVSLTRLVNLVHLDVNEDLETLKNIGRLTNLQQLKAFHVKRQDGHRVMELQNLNKICGSLHILNLENIEAKEEAQKAQLDRKDGLRKLKFDWEDTSCREEVQLDVLEGLCPSTNLNKLSLNGYMGTHLPNWLHRKHLPFLKVIKLYGCSKLKVFPSLTDSLEELVIDDSPHLLEIPPLPPKLQYIYLENVGVTSLFPSSSLPSTPCLPSLRTLRVYSCPNLDESLSALLKSPLPSLSTLRISHYRHPMEDFCYLTALSDLHLFGCSGKVRIDVGSLVSLKDLTISNCPSATIEDLHPNCTPCISLYSLRIIRSPLLLSSFSQSKVLLSLLKKLEIDGDDLDGSLLSECLSGLTALKKLVMKNCPNIASIQEEVLCTLVSMKKLRISCCGRLEGLDLLALSSLKSLYMESCPRFMFDCQGPPSSSDQLLGHVTLTDFRADQLAGLFSLLVHCPNVRLEALELTRCEGLPSKFPSLNFLKSLHIESCSDVTSFPVALITLCHLEILNCPNFTFCELPSMPFPSLEDLKLGGFDVSQLTHLIMRVIGSPLKHLRIDGCDDLISFDGDLELPFLSLTSLRILRIFRCIHLQQLAPDLRGLKCLRLLHIEGCSQISSIPEEGLPVSLEYLCMIDCPALEARYGQRDGNLHRQRISHIPSIEIRRGTLDWLGLC